VVVAFAHVLVERAFDGLLDVPAPNQEWIIGHVEIDVAEEHRGGRQCGAVRMRNTPLSNLASTFAGSGWHLMGRRVEPPPSNLNL
jgi:hypothetical protein